MSDVQTLLNLYDSSRLLRPTAERPGFVDLIRALGRLIGAEEITDTKWSTWTSVKDIDIATHYLLVLLDGVGVDLLGSLADGCSFAVILGANC